MGGDPSIPSLVKEHYAFCNIVISKGTNINNSHGELWGIMDSFICIIYDFDNGLIVVILQTHGAYMISVHELYYSDTR